MSPTAAAPVVLECPGLDESFQARRLAAVLRSRGLRVIETAGARARGAILAELECGETVVHVRQHPAHAGSTVSVALSLRLVDRWLNLAAAQGSAPSAAAVQALLLDRVKDLEFFRPLDDEHGELLLEEIAPSFAADPLARLIELRALQARAIETLQRHEPADPPDP